MSLALSAPPPAQYDILTALSYRCNFDAAPLTRKTVIALSSPSTLQGWVTTISLDRTACTKMDLVANV